MSCMGYGIKHNSVSVRRDAYERLRAESQRTGIPICGLVVGFEQAGDRDMRTITLSPGDLALLIRCVQSWPLDLLDAFAVDDERKRRRSAGRVMSAEVVSGELVLGDEISVQSVELKLEDKE